MIRLRSMCLAVLLMLSCSVASAAQVLFSEELTSELTTMYECSFEAELDETYRDTWLYGLSNNGTVNMKLQRVSGYGIVSILLTVGGQQFFDLPSFVSFGSKGIYDFNDQMEKLEGDTVKTYDTSGIDPLYLRITLNKNDGVNDISFWLHDGNSTDGKGMAPIGSAIKVDNAAVKESGADASVLFNINGEYKENIAGSEDHQQWLDQQKENGQYEEGSPVDYSDLSTDPRRFDDKEKSLAAYGKYRDENGVFHTVSTLVGTFRGAVYDYETTIEASFAAQVPQAALSADGRVTVRYYNIEVSIDGKPYNDKQLVKLEGGKGEAWFLSTDVEVLQADERVERDADSQLTDDCSIYMGFLPLERFDGKTCEYVTDSENVLGLTFHYDDKTKTTMKSVSLKYDGYSSPSGEIALTDIDYSGGLLSYFLKMVYPNIYQELAKEMGLTL